MLSRRLLVLNLMILLCKSEKQFKFFENDDVLNPANHSEYAFTLVRNSPLTLNLTQSENNSQASKDRNSQFKDLINQEMFSLRQQLQVQVNNTAALNQELNSLRQQLQKLQTNISTEPSKSHQQFGYIALNNGWIVPDYNSKYKYKKIDSLETWDKSRQICQSWEGDLITQSVLTMSVKNGIHQKFGLEGGWIGLTDREYKGDFRWVNGGSVSSQDRSVWHPDRPNNFGNCCAAHFESAHPLIWNELCDWKLHAVCEKLV